MFPLKMFYRIKGDFHCVIRKTGTPGVLLRTQLFVKIRDILFFSAFIRSDNEIYLRFLSLSICFIV